MKRRDQRGSRQQGGHRNEDNAWDSPRQANQWSDTGRQAGGGWGSDEEQRSSYLSDEERERELQRNRDLEAEGRYNEDRYGPRQSEDWQDRHYAGISPGARSRGEDFERDPGGLRSSFRRVYGDTGFGRDYEDRTKPSRGATYRPHYDASYGNDFSSFTSRDYGGRDFYANRSGGGYGTFGAYGHSSESYRPSYGLSRGEWFGSATHGNDEFGHWREYGERRGFFARAGDEIASWFGDENATRRREEDHRGRGPSDYTRSDERIREDVNDKLTHDSRVDATGIRVSVKDGEVSLDGTVTSRQAKRRAEDVADEISGVRHVQNNLRVQEAQQRSIIGSSGAGSTGSYSDESAATTSTLGSGTAGSATRSSDKPS